MKLRFDPISLRRSESEYEPAVPRAGCLPSICDAQRIAEQNRPVFGDLFKALCRVSDEIEFGTPSDFDLQSVLRDGVLLLFSLLRLLFLRHRLVIVLLRDDAFLQEGLSVR